MKKLMLVVFIFLTGLSLSCNQSKKSQNKEVAEPVATADNSKNSLDWDGVYRGVLPCADCPGIQTTIHLNKDQSFRSTVRYLGKEDNVFEHSGNFTWNAEGNTITLSNAGNNNQPLNYFVGENTLTQLDMQGQKVTGERATDYVLTKANYAIVEKYWKLTELNGKPVVMDSAFGREPHIILKDHDNRVNGFAGCNSLSGYYEVRSMDRISFSKIATTKMACPKLDLETEFLKALESADNFNVNGDELILNKARMAPLARFKTVYMK